MFLFRVFSDEDTQKKARGDEDEDVIDVLDIAAVLEGTF